MKEFHEPWDFKVVWLKTEKNDALEKYRIENENEELEKGFSE